MGLLGKIGDVFHRIEYHTSNDPEIVGKRFEDFVLSLFSSDFFKLVEKTHSFKTNDERYVGSSLNPDFIFEYIPTKEMFAVECKFRSTLNNKGQIEWSDFKQLHRYQMFQKERGIPVFIAIGYWHEVKDLIDKHLYVIPLTEARYPGLYKSLYHKYERDRKKPFDWKNGRLI